MVLSPMPFSATGRGVRDRMADHPGAIVAIATSVSTMGVATVTIALDSSVLAMAKGQARVAGLSVSAWIARSIQASALVEAARRYQQFDRTAGDADAMEAWDAEHRTGHRLAGAEW